MQQGGGNNSEPVQKNNQGSCWWGMALLQFNVMLTRQMPACSTLKCPWDCGSDYRDESYLVEQAEHDLKCSSQRRSQLLSSPSPGSVKGNKMRIQWEQTCFCLAHSFSSFSCSTGKDEFPPPPPQSNRPIRSAGRGLLLRPVTPEGIAAKKRVPAWGLNPCPCSRH